MYYYSIPERETLISVYKRASLVRCPRMIEPGNTGTTCPMMIAYGEQYTSGYSGS